MNIQSANHHLSALETIRMFYNPAEAPMAEQMENRQENRHYAEKIVEIAGSVAGKKILFLGMGQEEAAYLLAQWGAFVEYGTWSEKSLAFARKNVSPFYRSVADRVILHLIDPLAPGKTGDNVDLIVVMKAAKQLHKEEFMKLLHDLFKAHPQAVSTVLHMSPNAALTALAFMLAKIADGRRSWKSRQYGLHEYTFFYWHRMLRELGRPYTVVTDKQARFFSRQVIHQTEMPETIKRLTLLADGILDSAPLLWLSRGRLLSPFLSTDLWALVGGYDT